eukprot:TRINITY_DN3824_c0_g2_i2.p1 TRINITY_DN3824_c0_g2~~TRINITY_DN3824_c0_g2_i2.p1  ORF type:complete len:290 (+),score=53.62 TRINITY_DN3824_c0_g2_i2:159-1028(+)
MSREDKGSNSGESFTALASTAHDHFTSRAYPKAAETLDRLKRTVGNNKDNKELEYKLAHNAAVVQYYKGNTTEPKRLLETLAQLKLNYQAITESVRQEGGAGSEDELDIGLVAGAYVRYNEAVIHLQLRQYSLALEAAEPLFSVAEALQDELALRVGFLLLDLYVILKITVKISPVVMFLEKTLSHLRSEPSTPSKRSSAVTGGDNQHPVHSAPRSGGDGGIPTVATLEWQSTLGLYKARIHLLLGNTNGTKSELKAAGDAIATLQQPPFTHNPTRQQARKLPNPDTGR